ncbi:uncharacterized protein LOC131155355 isoform X2 [Malania oleifera]|uniref:uncharacterized protein LOC131155355 isoform X2 n=1 Tax=Malania oleifera TaxID=397392 RepID=UPI0025AE4E2F|nr:uncharacterized protein LOC131155355 isoform X2 [Malania oleifera]
MKAGTSWDQFSSSDSDSDHSDTEVANLCLMAHGDEVCLRSSSSKDRWYLDSGCSRHMTGDKGKFTSIVPKDGGYVTFGDNAKGRIIGVAHGLRGR